GARARLGADVPRVARDAAAWLQAAREALSRGDLAQARAALARAGVTTAQASRSAAEATSQGR
ncbi:MAG TPA: helicase SNF2, partial [Anaeromyxobacteraceae bacterium]|nr:helicase SNF2 [Anaeromyxobacteraceae bacterium]